ncbi:hypothetical protein HYV43_04920 [Candidatus Micrarchaeota archaeon]|nr:hypothetical protein [Candidatus Micrarchaeota archaeon]
MRETPTRPVEKHKHAAFLNKAHEFYDEMKHAESERNWSAASLNGIHCMISTADALCTYYLGKRSAGFKHEDAAWLVGQTGLPNCTEKAKQFLDVIRLKNLVEYEADEPTENQALQIVKQVTRFYEWAVQQINR